MSYHLFLDDERMPGDVTWIELPSAKYVIVRNMAEFVKTIEERGLPIHISFDNDLGARSAPEGRDCAKWLVDQYLDGKFKESITFTVHSKNVVAAAWINDYLKRFFEYWERENGR